MTTVADVDLSTWNRYATSPRLRGSNPFGLNSVSVGQASETNLAQSITDGDTTLARFFGYEHTSVSAISINSIVVASTSNEAPKALLASASNVSATGSRTLSSTTLNPYQDLEYRWLLTYSDDSPIEDLEGIIDPRDSTAVNPYTDQISPEFTCIIREAGSYKLTLTARAMSSTYLQVIEQVATTTITVAEDTQSHLWYDGASGNDANDGLDPWGFGLTTAVYTESTGELTQSGAFASYVHDVSVPFTDRDNYIYISKAGFEGLYRIASKTSNDTIVLAQKLGSDQTAVTSSDGAKLTYTGNFQNGKNIHLKGGNTYTITSSLSANTATLPLAVSSYGGRATVTTTTVSDLISLATSGSGRIPSYIRLSNVNFDAQGNSGTVDGTLTSGLDTNLTTVIFDRSDFINSSSINGISLQTQLAATGKTYNLLMYGIYVDNRYGSTGKANSRQGMFIDNRHGWQRLFGSTIDNDSDNNTLDHFYYASGVLDHFHCGYTSFRNGNAHVSGEGNNYGINLNSTDDSQYLSINNNLFGANSYWAFDISTNNNEADIDQFYDVVALNNKANVVRAFTFHYSCRSSMFSYNEAWGGGTDRGFFSFNQGTTFTPAPFQGVLYKNNVYGQALCDVSLGTTREIADNVAYQTANDDIFKFAPAQLGGREFIAKDNNLYAPNKVGNTIIRSDGTDVTLATFNASSADISGNTSIDPSWADPANGSFNGTPLGLAVTII